jgi:hypothetical protein
MFRALGDRVMYGRNGRGDRNGPGDNEELPMARQIRLFHEAKARASMPRPPVPPTVNPALREGERKEHKEHKEAAEVNGRRKWNGARKVYIDEARQWLNKS